MFLFSFKLYSNKKYCTRKERMKSNVNYIIKFLIKILYLLRMYFMPFYNDIFTINKFYFHYTILKNLY